MERRSILREKYCLLGELGRGGSGQTFLAVDLFLEKRWAIKIYQDKTFLQKEVQILKALEHPMIPRIVEYLEVEGRACLVMDYVEGADLAQLMKKGRIFSDEEVRQFAAQICDVLVYLHSLPSPVIYGDLKPHNLILQGNGRLKLVDFGCACHYAASTAQTVFGTRAYAAPEQLQGELTERTDLYNLGKTLEALYAGRDPGMRRIIRRLCRADPAKRFKSAREAARKVEELRFRKKRSCSGGVTAVFLLIPMLFLLGYLLYAGGQAAFWEAMEQGGYRQAISLCPWREEGYLYFLRQKASVGKTLEGLEQVQMLLARYEEDTGEHRQIWLEMGILWMQGNVLDPDFSVNYERADKCLQKSGELPETRVLQKLLKLLRQPRTAIDWQEAAAVLQEEESFTASYVESSRKLELLASLWMSGCYDFAKAGQDPWEHAGRLLEKAELIAREEGEGDQRLISIRSSLAQIYYLQGMTLKQDEELRESAAMYQELLGNELPEAVREQMMLRQTYIWEELGEYRMAADSYQRLLERYPDKPQYYCEYGLMELLNMQNIEKARLLCQQAQNLPGAQKEQSYRALYERLEGVYEETAAMDRAAGSELPADNSDAKRMGE